MVDICCSRKIRLKGKAELSYATLGLYFANIHGFTRPPTWVPCFFYSGAITFLLLVSMSHAILLLLSSLPNTISCKKDIIRGVRYISICMTRMFLLTEF